MKTIILPIALFVAAGAPASQAAITRLIHYVDATDGAAGNTRLASGGVFNAPRSTAPIDNDHWWTNRTFGNNNTVFTSNDFGIEDAPGLVTLLEGLLPGALYNLHAYLWVDDMLLSNWRLKASLSQVPPLPDDPAVSFSSTGASPDGGATYAPPAVASDFVSQPLLFEGNRRLLQANLGETRADSSGHIQIWIDDYSGTGSRIWNRTWYDGVGYALIIPEPGSVLLVAIALCCIGCARRQLRP